MTAPARVLSSQEPWAEYQLDDGTFLRFRLTACNFRLTGKRTAEGDPEYSFSQQVQCETHAPKAVARLFALPAGEVVKTSHERLKAGTPLAEGWNLDTAPCEYVAPNEDVG